VESVASPERRVVACVVEATLSRAAGTRGEPGKSVREKTMPTSLEGSNRAVTGTPLCRPMPLTLTG
jgi:hypothetical protein